MRFLFRVVSEVAGTAKDFIEIVVAGVVGTVLIVVTAALRLFVRLIIVFLVLLFIYWVYGLIPHH
jgi:hypothetical protein